MFDKHHRHITNRIATELTKGLVWLLWNYIDEQLKANVQLDYLQVFTIRQVCRGLVAIEQKQERPPRTITRYIPVSNEGRLTEKKIFVIDDGTYSTMLFADEY